MPADPRSGIPLWATAPIVLVTGGIITAIWAGAGQSYIAILIVGIIVMVIGAVLCGVVCFGCYRDHGEDCRELCCQCCNRYEDDEQEANEQMNNAATRDKPPSPVDPKVFAPPPAYSTVVKE